MAVAECFILDLAWLQNAVNFEFAANCWPGQ